MESTTVLAFRIFVMLSCLIIVPMAAIFGSAFPDVVKTVLVDRIVAWSTGRTLEAPASGSPAEFGVVTASSTASPASAVGEAPRWGQSAAPQQAWQTDATAAHSQGVVAAGAPTHPSTTNQPASFNSAPDGRHASSVYATEPTGSDQAARPTPLEGAQPSVRLPGGPANESRAENVGAAPPVADRFTAMEHKLREYGATYYLLETWGNEGEQYRFHCKMAIGNNPNYTRHFEATDRDALKAIAQVLERVEMWREGRLQ